MHSRSSLENHTPILDQNEQSVYRFSDQKVPKTIYTLWGCTYLYGLHKGVPRSPPNGFININHFIDEWLKSNKFFTNLFEEAINRESLMRN